jgi:hypothetical protein
MVPNYYGIVLTRPLSLSQCSSPCYKTRQYGYNIESMSQNATKMRLEDLEIKPQLITKLKGAGIESIFDLAISIPHQLIEDGGILTGADTQIALDIVTKAKKALIDSGLLAKDFSTAEEILERRKNLLKCTTGSSNLDSPPLSEISSSSLSLLTDFETTLNC